MKSKRGIALGEFTIWWIIAAVIMVIGFFFIADQSKYLESAKEFLRNIIGLG